jgi:hypothetical protein
MYARIAIPILLILLFGRLIWQGTRSHQHSLSQAAESALSGAQSQFAAPWTGDFKSSLDISADDAAAGNLAGAEISVDRAESFVTISRLESRPAPPDFLASASAQLDHVLQQNPRDRRLFEHVTALRTELAAYRSSLEPLPPPPAGGRVAFEAPRQIGANQTLDPATLKGNYLDATLLPDVSEILMPPFSRALADKIRVENLTITGAAQTLDGIRWRNVTFIDTRLRYEGRELSLDNVRFVRCRFGLPADERGAQIAGAIILAPLLGSVTLTEPAAPAAETP